MSLDIFLSDSAARDAVSCHRKKGSCCEIYGVHFMIMIIGKEVFRTENVKKLNLSIDLTELASGSYFVKVLTASGETIRKIQK